MSDTVHRVVGYGLDSGEPYFVGTWTDDPAALLADLDRCSDECLDWTYVERQVSTGPIAVAFDGESADYAMAGEFIASLRTGPSGGASTR